MKRLSLFLSIALALSACMPALTPALTPGPPAPVRGSPEIGRGESALTPGPSPQAGRGESALTPTRLTPDTSHLTPSPTPEPKFRLADFITDPEQLAALKSHPGLEQAITLAPDGTYSASVTVLDTEGQPAAAPMEVTPSTLRENLTLAGKNKYGDTPVMTAADGTTLYWIQEYKTWYAKTADAGSIHAPWRIPDGRPEISARMGIVDHPEDFSPAAVERWSKHQYQNALGFQWRPVNYNTGEGKKFGYLDNMTMSAKDLTLDNAPVQVLADDWYAMELPDGTVFRYFQLKWLDPKDPRNPKADEWKIIQVAPGTEITENEHNRKQFMYDLTQTAGNAPVRFVLPVFKADEKFFEFPNLPTALPIAQPSLAKLLDDVSDKFANLPDPNLAKWNEEYGTNLKIGFRINTKWEKVDPTAAQFYAFENDNKDYYDNFFPQEIQTLIFPAFVMRR